MKKKNRDINIFSMSALDLFASAMGAFLLISVMALPYYLKVDPDLVKQAQEAEAKAKQAEQQRQECANKRAECEEAKSQCETEKAKLKAQNQSLSEENAQLKSNQGSCEEEKRKLEAENNALKDKNEEYQKRLRKSFCVITIQWESSDLTDIDLHIIDPKKREYYYKKREYDSKASLTVDSVDTTQGTEVWVNKELQPGKYKIGYVYFKAKNGVVPVTVKGSVLTNKLTGDLPTKKLNKVFHIEKILDSTTGWTEVATIVVDENGNTTLQKGWD